MRRAALLFLLLSMIAPIASADQTVNVGPGFSFSPADVTIFPGETITWFFAGFPHSSTSDSATGPEVWNSGIVATGSTFAHQFNTIGTYPYYCIVHSSPGGTMMNGVVRVVAAPVALSITSVSPSSALPGTTVTIRGTGFQSGATVTFRGVAATGVIFVDSTTIRAVVPAIPPGNAPVVVTNPGGESATFNSFSVNAAPAAESSIPALSPLSLSLLALLLAGAGVAVARVWA